METNTSERLICLTITAYRNASLNEDEYRDYMTKVHAPLVSDLMEEYGILRYSMVSSTCPAICDSMIAIFTHLWILDT